MPAIPDWKAERIITEYQYGDLEKLSLEIDMKVPTIRAWARKRNLKRLVKVKSPHNKLPEEIEKFLIANYSSMSMEELSKRLNKKPHAIQELARKRGLSRTYDQRRGDLTPLLSGSIKANYWLGFLAGDGYISKDGHLMVSQSDKDLSILEEFSRFVKSEPHEIKRTSGFKTNRKTFRVAVFDREVGLKIRQLYGIQDGQTKTKTRISLGFLSSKDDAISFLCGCIDADGCRSCKQRIRIECDKSWYEVYKELMIMTDLPKWNVKLSFKKSQNKDYCEVILNNDSVKQLEQFVKDNQIAIGSRKLRPNQES